MKRIIYIIFAVTAACSCSLMEKPDSYYEKSDFFTNENKAEMGILGIYNVLPFLYGDCEMAFATSDDICYAQGITADNTRRDISHYSLTTSNRYVKTVWQYTYDGINRANYMIDGIENMKGYARNDKLKKLVAEAKFLRAFLSLNLIRYWGDVPYKASYTGDYQSAYGPRIDRELIYRQIMEDLDDAKILDWADASSSPERATQGAVRSLKMRALLQRAGYSLQMDGKMTRPSDNARKEYFTDVTKEWEAFLANGYHGFFDGGYEQLFRSFSEGKLNSKESIFEIAFYSEDGRTGAKGYWGSYMGPLVAMPVVSATETDKVMGRANALFRAIPEWRTQFFEDTDSRRDVAICTYQYNWSDGKHVKSENFPSRFKQYFPGKWRREWMPLGYKDPNVTDVNFCIIRYADVVLMAAEAYNEIGETGKAWELLNSVRARAGATPVDAANYSKLVKAPKVYDLPFIDDSDEAGRFRTALYWERGFELAFEGVRRFDLLRWGILPDALALTAEKTRVNASDQDAFVAGFNFTKGKHELFPIPLEEIQANRYLNNTNNPKY